MMTTILVIIIRIIIIISNFSVFKSLWILDTDGVKIIITIIIW